MASTYSPTLRIELIGTGDQSGLWGDTTNNNLGDLIEQAITGVESIPMTDTDYTLSALNGSVDEARNAVIIMTSIGSLTGSRNIIIPAVDKLYTVKNSTTGGQNIVVKTSGGTGITVPNGQTVSLYCDGTDCYQTVTTLSSPSLTGTPTAPTAAYGTNTTQIATTAFVQQAGLTGEIKMWCTASAPTGYLMCNGQTVSRSTYSGLFAVIGTTFGAGDGSTTFTLPNYTNRMPVGAGSAYALAATGGSADAIVVSHSHTYSGTTSTGGAHTHSVSDPGHGHSSPLKYAYNAGTSGDPGAEVALVGTGGVFQVNSNTTGISVNSGGDHNHTYSGTSSTAGSSGTNANLPPYLGIYFIIKY
jgi:microcystin-dependent protein